MSDPVIAAPDKGTNQDPIQNVIDDPSTVSDQFIQEILGEGKKPEAPAKGADEEATKRYEYWQGQADKIRKDYESVVPLVDEYKRYQPVVNYLKDHPEAFEALTKAPAQVDNGLKEPVAPTKPEGYSDVEAYNDPQSPSFKYRVAADEYSRQLTQYMFTKQKRADEELNKRAEAEERAKLEQAKIGEIGQTLITQFGFTQEQVPDFVQVMSSKESTSLPNLVTLYKVIKAKSKGMTIKKDPQGQFLPPPPIGGAGAGASGNQSEDDKFFEGISWFGKPQTTLKQ